MLYLPQSIRERYEVHSFHHAEEVLGTGFPGELGDIIEALSRFSLRTAALLVGGGNESSIPKQFSELLRPRGWEETSLSGDLVIRTTTHSKKTARTQEATIPEYLAGHRIDYVKNRVALDVEWNSKDQTFDRDLYAFRAFQEAGIISVGVVITRSESLNRVFESLGILHKYGASTTWMGKLLYRLKAGRAGGCPVLIIGITPSIVEDWSS